MKNLGKLIKYDFMDVSKLMLPFYIGMGVMGIVIRLFWFVLLNEKLDESVRISTGIFQFISYFGYVIAIIGLILMTYYAVIIRYYRSIYANEGYLTKAQKGVGGEVFQLADVHHGFNNHTQRDRKSVV